MTGEQLLQKLLAMTPEQLRKPVVTRVEDVGRWRATCYFKCGRIQDDTARIGYNVPESEPEVDVLVID